MLRICFILSAIMCSQQMQGQVNSIASRLSSSTGRLYLLNPAFYGHMEFEHHQFEFDVQWLRSHQADAALKNSYPVFRRLEAGIDRTEMNPESKAGLYSFQSVSNWLERTRTLKIGYGGAFCKERTDQLVQGYLLNGGAALKAQIKKDLALSAGFNLRADLYRGFYITSDPSIPKGFVHPVYNLDAGLGLKHGEWLTLGIGVSNLKNTIAGIAEYTDSNKRYGYFLKYRRGYNFQIENKIKAVRNFSFLQQINAELYPSLKRELGSSYGFVQYHIRCDYKYTWSRTIGLGFHLNNFGLLGPSISMTHPRYGLSYSFSKVYTGAGFNRSSLHEFALRFAINRVPTRKFKPLITPDF